MGQLDRRRRADLRLVPARIRTVRRRRPADGLDLDHRARRASDRAHDRGDHVHGAVRHLDGGDRARRPCRRPPRRGRRRASPASPRSRSAPLFMAAMAVLVDRRRATSSRSPFSARSQPDRQRDRGAGRDVAGGRRQLLHRRRRADHRGRRAARIQRHAHSAGVRGDLLLGRRLLRPAMCSAFPRGCGAVGIWIGLSIGVALYAVLLVWRFHLLTKRGYLPALP